MRNTVSTFLILAAFGISTLAAYFANQAVEQVATVRVAQEFSLGLVPTIAHFKMLTDELSKLAAKQKLRVDALEKYITENGLPVPADREPFAPGFDSDPAEPFGPIIPNPGEKIIGIDVT